MLEVVRGGDTITVRLRVKDESIKYINPYWLRINPSDVSVERDHTVLVHRNHIIGHSSRGIKSGDEVIFKGNGVIYKVLSIHDNTAFVLNMTTKNHEIVDLCKLEFPPIISKEAAAA